MSSIVKLSRRDLLTGIPLAVAGAGALPWRAFARASEPQYVELKTKYGRLRGAKTGDLTTFKGIPYGGSVSGANRFKAAPALQPWDGVRDALTAGPSSPQPGPRRGDTPMTEDCLTLNIWTPAGDSRKRPVMFYNHGGGFTTGSGSSGHQDGGNLARTFDVVVVATTHRLGLMGYLYLGEPGGEEYASSGNQGMLDIRDGLRWVHENIEAFGGDPGNVMIFGESGGGAKTSALYAMPSAAPYFHKASIESGPGIRMYPRQSAAETTLMVLDKLGIARNDWRKLLDVPVEKLMDVQNGLGQGGPLSLDNGRKGMSGNTRPGGFGPIVDGTFLPRHPFEPEPPSFSRDKPLLSGFDRDETVFFFNQQRQLDIYSLTDDQLKQRLDTAFGQNAGAVYEAYSKSRPGASPSDLYIAITTARMISVG
ncbi:MAG: carboxylesterase/lipase family protein, partial [Acidobacteria bacterium]